MLLKRALSLAMVSIFTLSACATASKDIAGTYASPIQYQSYDCDQLSAESQRINSRAAQLGGRLDEAASNDKTITGVGIVLFWPALFFLGGTKQQEAEYARLKGESEAVQQAAIQRKCAVAAPTPGPTPGPTPTPAAAASNT